ncbi:MAG: DUF5696 domain-containing protein [Oliverpabstia sp.]|nr:DUF5696 domain-containing protein [Oliverpabstia sp.]
MKIIEKNGTIVILNETSLAVSVERGNTRWRWREEFQPRLICSEGEFLFQDAVMISHEYYHMGIGEGIRSRFEGFEKEGKKFPYSFETLIWIEENTGDVYFEWVPLQEEGLHVQKVFWPGDMEFDEKKDSWYTLLTHQQGILIPNTWETELAPVGFNGLFETAGGYMPWFGQVKDREGYIAICVTPWNAGYCAEHPAGGPYTHVGIYFEPSLGKMDYRRIVKYTLASDCDYNDLCKIYREYVNEQGKLRTLAEKAARNPSVDQLIGCAFVHKGIKTQVQKNSDFFDPENPEKNNHLTSFAQREKEIRTLHEMGVEKLYLHLDGWAQPGYDNRHPDYLPACKEAGGWEGMKALSDALHECGYLFGIHDQYRDYYLTAPSFDENYACRLPDGTIPKHQRWAGGPQSYLCATQAPGYVRRNFSEIKKQGIELDGAYLDVFTCNEGDECDHPEHRMTRRECYEFRGKCFEYLLSCGILPSSEEVSDWAVPSLVFCHYAPYDFMMKQPGTPKEGIPVPLYNLVYHDCVIEPWMMDKVSEEEDYMLYALLNGGAPYLIRDAAYPNTDGAFDEQVKMTLEEQIKRCKVVSDLHEKVAKCEMLRHEIIDGDYMIQETTFSDGTKVKVDFRKQTYILKEK